jgi:anti-sigma regulatory factor (Ser/Thr protein kinase)
MTFNEVLLTGGPSAPAEARRVLRDGLRDRVPPRVLEDAGLLVSELVTNAVTHGQVGPEARLGLRLRVEDGKVRIEVRDEGLGFAAAAAPGPDDPGGYGLFLVTQIADAWGIAESGDPTTVWFELKHGAVGCAAA